MWTTENVFSNIELLHVFTYFISLLKLLIHYFVKNQNKNSAWSENIKILFGPTQQYWVSRPSQGHASAG